MVSLNAQRLLPFSGYDEAQACPILVEAPRLDLGHPDGTQPVGCPNALANLCIGTPHDHPINHPNYPSFGGSQVRLRAGVLSSEEHSLEDNSLI
jgi:hypothetical protein